MACAGAFAAALAMACDATVWTGDPELVAHGAPWVGGTCQNLDPAN